MPLPKRPSGGMAPQKVVPPKFGEQENSTDVDFALPELDDFVLPDIEFETNSEAPASTSEKSSNPATVLDSSKNLFTRPSSTNQDAPKPAQAAVSDVLGMDEDEDEETALDRELGLLDDDLLDTESSYSTEPIPSNDDNEEDLEDEDEYAEDQSEADNSLIELEENPSESEEDDDDTDFEDILRGLEETVNAPEQVQFPAVDDDDLDADWEKALADLENFNDGSLPEVAESNVETDDDDEDTDEDDEDEEEDGDWSLEEFTPPANPFEALPEDFQNAFEADDEDEDEEDEDIPEEDFVPPSDPFANPFADEESKEDEEDESSEDEEESTDEATKPSLKEKAAALLSPAKAKQGISDYFAKINAELHGEEPPKPGSRRTERNTEDQEPEDESEDQGEGSARSRIRVFGFLAPIRSFYTAIVNIIFGVITAILGILSKLPLIGFVFKIALEATKVLRAIAQYIPLAFFIAALVAVSYFSVPRDSLIGLPDSGGATFSDFKYDASNNSVSGVITNTGDIIADVQPVFKVKTIQPNLNPVSWVIPENTSKCVTESVRVDIDSTTKVTAKCSEPLAGFIPRVTGELK